MYCYKCGKRLEYSSDFCPKCGFPTHIYFKEKPPKLRLRYALSVPILILSTLGVAITLLLEDTLTSTILDVMWYISYNIFAPLVFIGLVLTLSTAFRNSFKYWLIDYITALGMIIFPIRHHLMVYIGSGAVSVPIPIQGIVANSFWALIVGGIIAKQLLKREMKSLNVRVKSARNTFKLGIICTSILMLIFVGSPLPAIISISVMFFVCGILAWIAWHLTDVLASKINVFRSLSFKRSNRTVVETERQVIVEDTGFTEIFIKSITPTLLSLSLISFIAQFMPWLGVDLSSLDVIFRPFNLILSSFLILIFVSPFVAPPSWLLGSLNLKVYDRRKETVEEACVIESLKSFIDTFSLIGVIYSIYQLGKTFTLIFVEEAGELSDIMLANLITMVTVNFFTYLWLLIATPAIIATTLYYKFTYNKHLTKLLEELNPVKITIITSESKTSSIL